MVDDLNFASETPAGATITSASLFGANDAASVGFMVLRLNGHVDFAWARYTRVNRAFEEEIWEKCVDPFSNI